MALIPDIPRFETLSTYMQRYPDLDPAAFEAFLTLLHVGSSLHDRMEQCLAAQGISHGRFILLAVLNRNPEQPMSATELAEKAGVTKQTITSLLDGVESCGLVKREAHPDDRRSTLVRLQPAGRALLDRILPPLYRAQSSLMSGLSADEQRQLVKLLKQVQLKVLCPNAQPKE